MSRRAGPGPFDPTRMDPGARVRHRDAVSG